MSFSVLILWSIAVCLFPPHLHRRQQSLSDRMGQFDRERDLWCSCHVLKDFLQVQNFKDYLAYVAVAKASVALEDSNNE